MLRASETIAAWGYDLGRYAGRAEEPSAAGASRLLGDGALEVAYSDFGRACPRLGVTVQGYER